MSWKTCCTKKPYSPSLKIPTQSATPPSQESPSRFLHRQNQNHRVAELGGAHKDHQAQLPALHSTITFPSDPRTISRSLAQPSKLGWYSAVLEARVGSQVSWEPSEDGGSQMCGCCWRGAVLPRLSEAAAARLHLHLSTQKQLSKGPCSASGAACTAGAPSVPDQTAPFHCSRKGRAFPVQTQHPYCTHTNCKTRVKPSP